ncbi:MAG: ABC transporter permease subunit [Dehalococcoidia bacterium]|nr:ABC transporter permease subunit [Dehalococcoidia bacterium]
MKNIITVLKKELTRVIKSRRTLIMLLMPGVLIYVLWSLMGSAMQSTAMTSEEEAKADTYNIFAINIPPVISEGISELGYSFDYITADKTEIEAQMDLLIAGDIDLVLVFDESFVDIINNGGKPSVDSYYNPYISKSEQAFNVFSTTMGVFRNAKIAERLTAIGISIDVFENSAVQVFDENKAAGGMIAQFLPMVLIMLLFSGCMGVTTESIAGEKERGTIATLLSTPVKRWEIAVGKIAALSILASISAVSSFLGLVLSLPRLLGTNESLFSFYGFGEMLLLLLIIMATVLVITGAMSLISSFAKNVREATMLTTPLLMLGVLVAIINMVVGMPPNVAFFLIPLYNASASIASVLSFEVNSINFLVTIISNIVCVAIFVYLLTKMFNSEKVMFSK